jgi:mannose/fructose/N-acetylgalactosamine-specific phosphotransferase system component IID
MYLVIIAWLYVVLMMAVAEALHSNGSVLGAVITFVLYGLLPLSIVVYVMGTPLRRKARLAQEKAAESAAAVEPDAGGHAPGATEQALVAPVRKEP